MNSFVNVSKKNLLKEVYGWMDEHRDGEDCGSDMCKEMMDFLRNPKYRDISDEETAELLIENFRMNFVSRIISGMVLDEFIKKENRRIFWEKVYMVLVGIFSFVLLGLAMYYMVMDQYAQANFNLLLLLTNIVLLNSRR